MDQLDAMRMFVRVAELESFTRSAEQLGVPKATLSAAIRRLEEQMGTRLLQRTTRRVQLTTDGRLCYARCQDLLADMEEFNGLFRQQGQLSGQLRVDMPGRMARHLVMPALPAFLAAHPALQLMLSSTDRRVDLVREGFDCVIRVGALEPSSLVARPLGHYRQINCASAAYLARYGTPRSLSELSGHRLVHYGSSGPRESGFEYLQADGSRAVLAMSGALTVNDSESYLAAALAGLGIIQQPRVGVEPLLASGELVAILPKWQAPPLPIHALYAHRRQLAPRVQAFIQWLSGILASALGPDGPRDSLATRAGMDAAD
ncbi:LysR family transcriptional regulator [Aeromonas dhakensis]|uniref:LysR family transcriptional regulator n=1 Tax=Aeromonas dhakensis TaxID=196024 RepID=UPI00191D5826|nr:LysR family transcriptional regulator [Aeromonas dhakensis]MBL0677971.1 LysR family transcriptional regulator [Aeromonas dhakensis]UNU87686.1 LysR family transcriptional regulator [Aeromonas dhakensis]UXB12074.1 LysR family transcriptional regulator [Aeromonas dhakensis]